MNQIGSGNSKFSKHSIDEKKVGRMLPGRALTHTVVLQRKRRKERNDFMLKEGDGYDPAVSHVPCGALGGLQRLLLVYSLAVRPLALLSSALLQHLESV